MATTYKWNFDAGATARFAIGLSTRDDDTGVLTAVDLTGYTAVLRIRDERRLTVQTWNLEFDDEQNLFMVYLTPAETAQFPPNRRHYFVVDVTEPINGDVSRWLQGPMYASPFAETNYGELVSS